MMLRPPRGFIWLPIIAVIAIASAYPADNYRIAVPGYHYEFPRDHFNHPDFRTEWWYYTGNLASPDGRRFGFELTFFRQAVAAHAVSGVPRLAVRTEDLVRRSGAAVTHLFP